MRPRAFLLHGFNVTDGGAATTDQFAPLLRDVGYEPVQLDYGWTGLVGVRLCNGKLARWLARLSRPGDVVLAHSNGCAVAAKAVDYGAELSGLVFLNPALDRDWAPGPAVQWWHVYYNARDPWTAAARWLPWHPWGAMGHDGPSSEDTRLMAVDTGERGAWGHSPVLEDFASWGPEVVGRIASEG